MQKYLVVSIITQDKAGLAEHFSGMASDRGCNVEDSRMAVLGNEFAAIMLISGDESQIQAARDAYATLQQNSDFQVCFRDTDAAAGAQNSRPYSIQTLSLDGPGIIRRLTDFLAQQNINIEDLQTNSYHAPHTGAPMLDVQMIVNIPASVRLSVVRDDFADLCDELQIDAIFEPIKY